MSSEELEKYIQPDSKFVPQAIECAFKILESRGKEFSPEEIEKRNSLIEIEKKKAEVIIHPNHTKASNLIYLSCALGIGNVIWTYESLNSVMAVFITVISIAFVFGLGYLAGIGTEWIKYVLLILLVLGVVALPAMIMALQTDPVVGILNIIQTALQIWAVVLLFKVPKTANL